MGKIGNGGFSSVYKVKNLLDNSLYAIKKLKIKIKNKNKDFENEILKVFQEIRFLAKLKDEHIVDYNHSWVEVNLKEEKIKDKPRNKLLTEKDLDFKNCEINDINDFNLESDENENFISYESESEKNKYKKIHKNKIHKIIDFENKIAKKSQSLLESSFNNTDINPIIKDDSSFNIEKSGNTKTDSSDYSCNTSERNKSFDDENTYNINKNSLSSLYGLKSKYKLNNYKKSKKDFIDNSDLSDNENDESFNKKKCKKLSMHLPGLNKQQKTSSSKRKSTICIKNKEYLYEYFFL